MHDRLRAKPPATDPEEWREGVVRAVDPDPTADRVTVTVEADGERVAITVTTALYDLFAGRTADSEDPVGEPAWFK